MPEAADAEENYCELIVASGPSAEPSGKDATEVVMAE